MSYAYRTQGYDEQLNHHLVTWYRLKELDAAWFDTLEALLRANRSDPARWVDAVENLITTINNSSKFHTRLSTFLYDRICTDDETTGIALRIAYRFEMRVGSGTEFLSEMTPRLLSLYHGDVACFTSKALRHEIETHHPFDWRALLTSETEWDTLSWSTSRLSGLNQKWDAVVQAEIATRQAFACEFMTACPLPRDLNRLILTHLPPASCFAFQSRSGNDTSNDCLWLIGDRRKDGR